MTHPLDDGGRRYADIRVDVDEATLGEIANLTGGRYFRATDRESLTQTYAEIDALETSEIEVEHFVRRGELFAVPLIAGLVMVVAELTAASTVARRLP